jgi:RodZ C-terminal domain
MRTTAPPQFRTSSVGYHREDVDAFIRALMDEQAPLQERVAELEAVLEATVQALRTRLGPRQAVAEQRRMAREHLENQLEATLAGPQAQQPVPQAGAGREQPAAGPSLFVAAPQTSPNTSRRLAYALVPLLIAAAAVLAVMYVRIPIHRFAADSAGAAVERATPATSPSGTTATEALEPGSPVPSAAVPPDQPESPTDLSAATPAGSIFAEGLTIFLSARERCWIRATLDGERKVERELAVGEQATVQARNEVVLRVGNAGAISLTINGAAALPLGREGEPVTTRITPANYVRFLEAIPTASSLIVWPEQSGSAGGAERARTPAG